MLRYIQNSCDTRLKLTRYQCSVKIIICIKPIVCLFRISSSKYSLCLIILDVILEFGETIASPCVQQVSQLCIIDRPIWQLLSKTAHIVPERLVFLEFLVCIKIKTITGYVDPGITQIALHCPVVFCYSPITYKTRKLYYHKTLLSKNL